MGYTGFSTIAILVVIKTPLPFCHSLHPSLHHPPTTKPLFFLKFLVRSLFQLKLCVKSGINKMELSCFFFLFLSFSHCKNRFAFSLSCSQAYFLICQKQPYSLQLNETTSISFTTNPQLPPGKQFLVYLTTIEGCEVMVKKAVVALLPPLFQVFIKNLMYVWLHPPKHGKIHPCENFHFVNTCHLHMANE